MLRLMETVALANRKVSLRQAWPAGGRLGGMIGANSEEACPEDRGGEGELTGGAFFHHFARY